MIWEEFFYHKSSQRTNVSPSSHNSVQLLQSFECVHFNISSNSRQLCICLKVMKWMNRIAHISIFLSFLASVNDIWHMESHTSRLTQNVQIEEDSACYRWWFVCHFNYIIWHYFKNEMKWKARPIQLNGNSFTDFCVFSFGLVCWFHCFSSKTLKNIRTERK